MVDRDIAKQLMDNLATAGIPLNRVAELIEGIQDDNERKNFRKTIATIMAHIYTDLELPIIRQYPELDPDKYK